ncbi:MAG TPA: LamG-like jellyroll fold domain-containing protein, partial [Candidatus Sulfotelmatobacter sp.]|nr:LamG-like jellyroll fold domain-containing protein [Candidatus Sulfotelmatobacter sp.]
MKTHHSLKGLFALTLVAALPRLAHAQPFNPVPLTQSSYTFSIVVPAGAVQPVPECVSGFVGSGQEFTDNTFYEQGLYTPIVGATYYNSGVPIHNTIFTNINNSNMRFLMPPTYANNDDLMIVSGSFGFLTPGTLTFTTPTTATSLALLDTGGNGGCTVNWTVTYQNGNTQSGTLSVPDWFNGGSAVAWGCNGREDQNGDLNNLSGATANNQVPYLYATLVAGLSSASPVVSIQFAYSSGSGVDNFFAVSTSTDGVHYTPAPVTGFNISTLIPNTTPYPVNATMDNGTNLANPGNTWFESGYYTGNSSYGLPASGSTFTSYSQPTHTYQMGNYSTNDATLIDQNHLSANITPVTPAAYTGLAFLTAGGDIGSGSVMTNVCIIQHADGVNETNLFYAYDWFNQSLPTAIAWESNGRVYMNSRSLNNLGNQGLPYLFESYFPLADTASPVTNIAVQYLAAPSADSTTFIMAVSGATQPIAPIITQEPTPTNQVVFPSQAATISAGVVGTAPITNQWLVEQNGAFVPLSNGTDANGSIVSGATTTSLTVSDLTLLDSTNYEYIAENGAGSVTSIVVSITVEAPGTAGVAPIAEWNNIANESYPLGTSTELFSSTGPGGGLATLNIVGSGALNGYASYTNNGNGGNSSLMDGYMDNGAGGTSPTLTISGLNNSTTYDIYLYDFGDESMPQDGTDGLPNYTVNGTQYYVPTLGGLTPTPWDLESEEVGGTNFVGTGFIGTTSQATNDFNSDITVANFGDYTEITGVSPVSGVITIAPESDTTSYRSPLNGIELIPASGPSFGVHFLGNTADPVAIAPTPAFIRWQSPVGTVSVPTNHPVTIDLSVTVDESSTPPLSYQWYRIASGNSTQAIASATNSVYPVVATNGGTFFCIVTNFVGSSTSAPSSIDIVIPPPPSAYASAVMGLNPIGYWPLNETSGTIAYDYAGTNNGNYQGNYQLGQTGLPPTAGVGANTSVSFDGTSGDVDIPSGGLNWNLNLTGPMTVVEWVNCPTNGETDLADVVAHSDSSYRMTVAGGDSPDFADAGPDDTDPNPISNQVWHQLTGVYDGTNEFVYVDGSLVAESPSSGTPPGSLDDVNIARAPDYGNRYFAGNICQVAIYNRALTASQIETVYASIESAPSISISPGAPTVDLGNSITLSAAFTGTPATSLQWFYIDNSNNSNNIAGATSSSYTISNPPASYNGYKFGLIAGNAYGTTSASVTLTVVTVAASFAPGENNIGPLNAQTYAGAPVTYIASAAGSAPISYLWTVDGQAISGATNAAFTVPAECGAHLVQVTFSNAYNAGTPIVSSAAALDVTSTVPVITFETNGTGWKLNSVGTEAVPTFTSNNVVELTDNNGGEASSLFYSTAQYVGSFNASFVYQAGGGLAADGTCFILQNSPDSTNSLGGGGGQLGFYGITNSVALEFNLYSPDGG